MSSELPSLDSLADQLCELALYGPLREHARGTIDTAAGLVPKRLAEPLSESDCVKHSLIAGWLERNGYGATAMMMKVQMVERWINEPEKYVIGEETLDEFLMKLAVETEGIERTERVESKAFPKEKKEPMRITPMSEEELEEMKKEKEKEERKKNAVKERRSRMVRTTSSEQEEDEKEDEESDDDDDSSSGDSEEENEEENEEEGEKKEEIDKYQEETFDEEEEDNDEKEEETKTKNNFQPLSWGPSKLALVTDSVSEPLPSIFSSHLPPLSISQPSMSKKAEQAIDNLFDDDFELDDFDLDEMEVTEAKDLNETGGVEEKENDKKNEDPNTSFHVVEKNSSDGESIDELEEFDTGLLSSGGSDYSF